ncbi:biotin/lipoyl-binding protein [Synechocystis salina]|uniref:HlyD family efflux transporter periplasmic adaptor subunit n=1 Tax=Synechocystis salina LEGE 00031 TaxID=1828736 RepID=A0ABR9VTH4_9SYNC|nr:HlyD family efflux transporter periplasmic adaptor subunit [Synechocystis salina]MBE9242054.1 HlyD family efflux transporter periplasmic adaptor subunit [Synechocystis salina LEGE 00041]MBE9254654.1 HlyD family efflux transporter periplasmic adaptor subunit [Synechocystis salina LEGE 00031]
MGESTRTGQLASPDHSLRWIILAMVVGVLFTGGIIFYSLRSGVNQGEENASGALAPAAQTPEDQPVAALGRIAPLGEIIKLSASPGSFGGAKVSKVLVKEGDKVKEGQVVAVLDSYEQKAAAVVSAQESVRVAQADLAIIEAGAKRGQIAAQESQVRKAQAELEQNFAVNQAALANLVKQLEGERIEQQATIDRLQAEVNQAANDDRRYRSLAENGAIAMADWEQRRLNLETSNQRLQEARARLMKTEATLEERIREQQSIRDKDAQTMLLERESARATLSQIAEIRQVDVQKAQAELNLAMARFQEARAELDTAVVRAPVDSQVLKIYSRPGEKVSDTNGILDLGITSQMIVVAEVYENDIGRVELGQTAWIRSENDSFGGELEGKVTNIGLRIGKNDVLDSDPAADIDARVVEVKIALSPGASKKVAGLSNAKVVVKIEPDSAPPSPPN